MNKKKKKKICNFIYETFLFVELCCNLEAPNHKMDEKVQRSTVWTVSSSFSDFIFRCYSSSVENQWRAACILMMLLYAKVYHFSFPSRLFLGHYSKFIRLWLETQTQIYSVSRKIISRQTNTRSDDGVHYVRSVIKTEEATEERQQKRECELNLLFILARAERVKHEILIQWRS